MGRLLGSHSDDQELDRPDLNKCPDCDCFFAGDNCPLCGKECPENMRAGNRPAVKHKKKRRSSGSSRVTFIEWYHSWWFIIIMMFIFPLAGIILLITSPHKTWKKVLFVSIAVIYSVISFFGIGSIFSGFTEMFDKPVDDSISMEEYIEKCESITAEQFYRASDGYKDRFVCMKLQIEKKVTYTDEYYNDRDYTCYLCFAENGSQYKIVIRDCLLEDQQRFVPGDVITAYGEGAGECHVFDDEYGHSTYPCLNMAYVVLE
ncbi:MAG: hypothetical protein IKL40_05635 [Clostridia bacterium]|nr:hypothetical protein [Clostridia bacterium]